MSVFAMIVPHQSHLFTVGLFLVGAFTGGWLALKPQDLQLALHLEEFDGWSLLIIQIIGQVILGMVVAPIMFTVLQWIYF